MASTSTHLLKEEQSALLRTAKTYRHPNGHYQGMEVYRTIQFFLATGAHPSVLADPQAHDLQTYVDDEGVLRVRWLRPKKRGMKALTHPAIGDPKDPQNSWVPAFVEGLHKKTWTRLTYHRMVRDVGRAAGVQGEVSPRTLRHTWFMNSLRQTRDPEVVQEWGNVSPATLLVYLRELKKEKTAEWAKSHSAVPTEADGEPGAQGPPPRP